MFKREFGEFIGEIKFKVLDERQMRASAGIMFLLGLFASINAFLLQRYIVVPYIAGFLVLNFMIGIIINPKYSPTVILARLFVGKQTPLYIGAAQKKFAWSLGLILASVIFVLSFPLLTNETYFRPVCLLCILCLILLYLETAFAICIGCKIYRLFIRMKILPEPEVNPNCMGDACDVETES